MVMEKSEGDDVGASTWVHHRYMKDDELVVAVDASAVVVAGENRVVYIRAAISYVDLDHCYGDTVDCIHRMNSMFLLQQ